MKTSYIERFSVNSIFGLYEQREFMLNKVQNSKAGSSRFYPIFVPRPATQVVETDHGE